MLISNKRCKRAPPRNNEYIELVWVLMRHMIHFNMRAALGVILVCSVFAGVVVFAGSPFGMRIRLSDPLLCLLHVACGTPHLRFMRLVVPPLIPS